MTRKRLPHLPSAGSRTNDRVG